MEHIRKIQSRDEYQRPNRRVAMAVTILLHAVVVIALLQYEPVRSAFSQARPIMVSLIAPQPIVQKPLEPPKPLAVKPRLQQPTTPEPKQLITAITDAPAPVLAPTPQLPQPAPVEAAPPPQPITMEPVIVIPPNFNADYLDNPPPVYPALSRRMSEQGKVVLRVLVNPKGTADKVELKSSSGSRRLDDAAFDTVKRWRFLPARQGDQPVAAL